MLWKKHIARVTTLVISNMFLQSLGAATEQGFPKEWDQEQRSPRSESSEYSSNSGEQRSDSSIIDDARRLSDELASDKEYVELENEKKRKICDEALANDRGIMITEGSRFQTKCFSKQVQSDDGSEYSCAQSTDGEEEEQTRTVFFIKQDASVGELLVGAKGNVQFQAPCHFEGPVAFSITHKTADEEIDQ